MKKVLSFVLILALVLGSFSFAFGLTDVATGDANSDAINVSNDLGIIDGFPDGTFKAGEAVNRAQFAKMVTRALGVPDSALAGFTSTKFKDTSGYGWAVPYLAFCDSKGIMLGDGMGNAMPGRTINLNEAVTMVLRAVGYTANSAELVGAWPANYVTMAQDKGLYDDVASMATVDRGNAAQVLYNALTLAKVQVDSDGFTAEIGKTIAGVWVPATMLTAGLNCTESNGGKAYVLDTSDANNAVINAQKYVGAFVKTFLNDDDDIVAIEAVSTFLTGKYIEKDNVFKAGGEKYNISSPDAIKYGWTDTSATNTNVKGVSPMAIANGQNLNTTTAMIKDEIYTIAVNLSGKTIKEVYSIAKWTGETSFKFEDGMLDDKSLLGYKFTLDDNKAIDNSRFILVGVSSLGDIADGDVVTVYQEVAASSNKPIVKIGVSNEEVTGTITKVSGSEYTLDGKVYEKGNTQPTISLGETGTALLDHNGDIAFWTLDSASAGNYAMFIGTKAAVEYGKFVVSVKLVDKTGAVITPTLKNDLTPKAVSLDGIGIVAGSFNTYVTQGSIVEYSLDSSGKIDKLDSAKTTTTLSGTTSKDGSLIGTTPIYDGVVVFMVDKNGDFEIGKVSDFDKDISFDNVSHTAIKDDGKIKAIAVVKSHIYSGGDYVYGVVNSTGKALDANKDKFMSLAGWYDGVEFDKPTDQGTSSMGWTTTTKSGIARLAINSAGVITEFVSGSAIPSAATDKFVKEEYAGTATTVSIFSGNKIKLSGGQEFIAAPGAVVYLWNSTEEAWELSTTNSLKDKYVKMYTTDKDKVTGFDIILAWEIKDN